jgi:uncharacterized membrane protein
MAIEKEQSRLTSHFSLPYVAIIDIILVLGASLILYQLDNKSLWYDEFSVRNLSSKGFAAIWQETYNTGRNPSWFWYFLHFFTGAEGDYAPRFAPALFGILNIALIYALGRKLFSKAVGIIAALMLALSPLHLNYAQEIREYSALISMSMFATLTLLSALANNRSRDWALFAVATTGLVTVHAYGLLPAVALGVFAIVHLILDYQKSPPTQRQKVGAKGLGFALSTFGVAVAWIPAGLIL